MAGYQCRFVIVRLLCTGQRIDKVVATRAGKHDTRKLPTLVSRHIITRHFDMCMCFNTRHQSYGFHRREDCVVAMVVDILLVIVSGLWSSLLNLDRFLNKYEQRWHRIRR